MKAAIYIRVSTQLQSTDRQRTELTEYANKQGYQVVNIYEDYCSGFKDRASYNRLKVDAKKGLFDIVLFSEMSRMTRKNILLSEVDYFKGNNVQVYFQKQNILVTNKKNDLGTSILLSVMSAISSYEVELMKERTTSGKIEKYKSKPFRIGNLSFGYYSDSDSTIHVDESKRQTVIDLFTKYAEGWRTSDIVEWLNIEVPEKTWHSYEIVRILKRDIYRGNQVVNIGGQNLSRYHESLRIISDELSDRVIAQMDKNKRKSRNVAYNYILNDLIFCPGCGRTIRGRVTNKQRDYMCAGHIRFHRESGKGCTVSGSYNCTQLEYIVWNAVRKASVYKKNEMNIKEQLEQIDALILDLHHQLQISETQLSTLDNELNNYIKKAVRYNLPDSAIDEFNAEIQRKKRDLNSNIESMTSRLKSAEKQQAFLTKSGDEASIQALLNEAENDTNIKKKYIHDFVERIVIQSIERTNYMTIKTKNGYGYVVKWRKYQKGVPVYKMTPFVDYKDYKLPDLTKIQTQTQKITKEQLVKISKSLKKYIKK